MLRILPLIASFCMTAAICSSAGAASTAAFDMNVNEARGLGEYLSARFAANHHDLGEAAKYFIASLEQDPDNEQLLTFSFFYATSSGDVEQAAGLARRLVVKSPDDRAARLTLAVAALKAGDYRSARMHITKSAKGTFTSFTVALIDGWAAAGQGDKAGALAELKTLHEQRSADAMAYFNEAMVNELLGDKVAADSAYQQALTTAGPTPRVVEAYGRFLERNSRGDEARALYQKMMGESGFTVITGPGLARIAKHEMPQPLVAGAGEGAADALFGIAASLNDEASRDVSILYLRLALYLQPKLDLATILLASRFESIEKYDDAIQIYGGIGVDSPYQRYAAVRIAVDLARLDKMDEAIARLKSLTDRYPDDVDTWTALGDSYRKIKKYDEAAGAYTRAVRAAGPATEKQWPLYFARAVAEHLSDHWPSAEADLQLALSLSPNQPQVLNYLGYTWVEQGRNIKEALGMLEKARALSPQDGFIVDSVGWAYYRLGRYAEAEKALEDAIQLVPGDPTINDHLGDVYWRRGRKFDALYQWSHALAFGAEEPDKTKIEKKLQNGLKRDDRS